MKKFLVLKSNYNEFENFFTDRMQDADVLTMSIYREQNIRALRILRRLFFKLPYIDKSLWYGEWKNHVEVYDTIILFDNILGEEIFQWIKKKNNECRLIFWHWNKIKKRITVKSRALCEEWTFDDNDSVKYGLKKNTQFTVLDIETEQRIIMYDAIFIGQDKGRLNCLLDIRQEFIQSGLKLNLLIVKDNKKYSRDLLPYLTGRYLKYSELLELERRAACIIDICQKNQTGMTLRVLESLAMKKKMITNNENIKKTSFYTPSNIYIWGCESRSIKEFIDTETVEISNSIIQYYNFNKWIKRFSDE